MDRAEYREKLQRIRDLEKQGNYSLAADEIEGVNWKKVKSASTLCNVGKIMAKAERYEEAKQILLMAYDRASVGRSIVHELVEIALAEGNLQEAEEYFSEYQEIAPKDSKRYALEYQMAKALDKPLKEQIRILEALNKKEFSEEWLYELAVLYHKAGEDEKCVKACDNIALYFGEGEYVAKALELKAMHQPLTAVQKEQKKENEEILQAGPQNDSPQLVYGGEAVSLDTPDEDAQIDSMNLQAELAKGMQQIMDAKDPSSVNTAMGEIKKAVKDSNLPLEEPEIEKTMVFDRKQRKQLAKETQDTQEQQEAAAGEAGSQEDAAPQDVDNAQTKRVDTDGVLSGEAEGQDGADNPDNQQLQEKPQSQMSMEELLRDWEEKQRANAEQIEKVGREELEASRKKALIAAQNLLDQISILNQKQEEMDANRKAQEAAAQADNDAAVISAGQDEMQVLPADGTGAQAVPYEEAGQEQQEASYEEPDLETPYGDAVQAAPYEEAGQEAQAAPYEEAGQEAQAAPYEEAGQEEPQAAGYGDQEAAGPETIQEEAREEDEAEASEEAAQETDAFSDGFLEASANAESAAQAAQERANAGTDSSLDDEIINEADLTASIDKDAVLRMLREGISKVEEPGSRGLGTVEDESAKTQKISEISTAIQRMAAEQMDAQQPKAADKKNRTPDVKKLVQEARREARNMRLTPEQKKVFTYFTAVDGMEGQIVNVLGDLRRQKRDGSSMAGNLVVTGEPRCGKTRLAMDMVKVIQESLPHDSKKVGKIQAESLNGKSIAKVFKSVYGGYLLIENAGQLDPAKAKELDEAMEGETGGLMVILEDTRKGIANLLKDDISLASKFTERIRIPAFTNDELVGFGKVYAEENGYAIDEMAVLTLYERIAGVVKAGQATSLEQVKDIIDDAITHAERGRLSMTMRSIFSSRKDEEEEKVLVEKDFQ